jgi:hypothetical protein
MVYRIVGSSLQETIIWWMQEIAYPCGARVVGISTLLRLNPPRNDKDDSLYYLTNQRSAGGAGQTIHRNQPEIQHKENQKRDKSGFDQYPFPPA